MLTRLNISGWLGQLAVAGLLLLSMPIMREILEASPTGHMLIQMPLLAIFGGLALHLIPDQFRQIIANWDQTGVTRLLLAVFTIVFWMIPRNLDAAIDQPAFEITKFLTLPLFAGLGLAGAWQQIGVVLRAFLKAQFVAMLAFLGWVYVAAPIRICNNYLEDQQQNLGWLLLGSALVLAAQFAAGALFGDGELSRSAARKSTSSNMKGVSHVR